MLLLLLACRADPDKPTAGDTSATGDTSDTSDTSGPSVEIEDNRFTVRCNHTVLQVSPFSPGVVRLRYGNPPASYVVAIQPVTDPAVIQTEAGWTTLRIETMTVAVETETCRVKVTNPDGVTLLEEPEGGGFHDTSLIRLLEPEEHLYGLGERTGDLDRRGRRLGCRNTDVYNANFGGWAADTDPMYQCIPFYQSLRNGEVFGVFTDVSRETSWDLGNRVAEELNVSLGVTDLDQYLIAGPGFGEVLERYTALTGRPPLPPRWSLGYSQSRWGWSSPQVVLDVVSQYQARNLPLSAVWLDIQHMDGFRSWTWEPTVWGDPAALIRALGEVKAVTIVDPAIKVDPGWDLYQEGLNGHLFLEENGAPWVGTVWPGEAVFPDFSNPATRAWWAELAADDLGYGVAGFWLDMNEPSEFTQGTVPDSLTANGNGQTTSMAEIHNLYGQLEVQATYEGLRSLSPDTRPFLLSRAGYAGIQRYAAAWTGDAPSTWETLEQTLPMLLGMGLSGETFVGSDVGGYSGGATPELFARWMQVGSFSPLFRTHLVENAADQYPWSFGTEVEDISRGLLAFRQRLTPYFYSLAYESSQNGAPILRPLIYQWPEDPTLVNRGDEAMLGAFLLVAPILEMGATTREVQLPAGRWFEWTTGVLAEGTIFLQNLPLAALPVYVREGAIVPMEETDGRRTIGLWPGSSPSEFQHYEDAGDGYDVSRLTTFSLSSQSDGATLTVTHSGSFVPNSTTLHLIVRRVDHAPTAVELNGLPVSDWSWDENDLSLSVIVPETDSFTVHFQYDPSLISAAPPVAMPFQVTLPANTPTDTPISIASSADNWASHTPLTRSSDTTAEGTLLVPRGEYLYYKYTRGTWGTVEKWPGCVEAANRYERGQAAVKVDTVYEWADGC